ncbi:hypothetical protein PAPHI01_2064 [Pancytospora philotis]|nr:hypothetical protein PAPHI01_2064 [Pancytospora philotis]
MANVAASCKILGVAKDTPLKELVASYYGQKEQLEEQLKDPERSFTDKNQIFNQIHRIRRAYQTLLLARNNSPKQTNKSASPIDRDAETVINNLSGSDPIMVKNESTNDNVDRAADKAHDAVDKVDETVGNNVNDDGTTRKKVAGKAHEAVEGTKDGVKSAAGDDDKGKDAHKGASSKHAGADSHSSGAQTHKESGAQTHKEGGAQTHKEGGAGADGEKEPNTFDKLKEQTQQMFKNDASEDKPRKGAEPSDAHKGASEAAKDRDTKDAKAAGSDSGNKRSKEDADGDNNNSGGFWSCWCC